jgi:hypothetical protein
MLSFLNCCIKKLYFFAFGSQDLKLYEKVKKNNFLRKKNGKSGVSDAIETLNVSNKKTKQDILKRIPQFNM